MNQDNKTTAKHGTTEKHIIVNQNLRKAIASNLQMVAEHADGLHRSTQGILAGYQIIGEHSDHEKRREQRRQAKNARYNSPFIIRLVSTLIDFAYSRQPDLGAVTTNQKLQELVNEFVGNQLSSFTDDLVENVEYEMTSGEVIVRIVPNVDKSMMMLAVGEPDEFDFDQNISHPADASQTWLHHREYKMETIANSGRTETKTVSVYYPDHKFWPEPDLRESLDKFVQARHHSGTGGEKATIDWDVRIVRYRFNGGVPVALPAVAYAQCLDRIISLQSSVLSAIASIATYYQVQDADEREESIDAFMQLAENKKKGKRVIDANTIVGSGKVGTVNVNIAMLSKDSALVRLLLMMIYNSAAGLRPQDWSEPETGALSSGAERNKKTIIAAKRRQGQWSKVYNTALEAAVLYAMHEASLPQDSEVAQIVAGTDGDTGAVTVKDVKGITIKSTMFAVPQGRFTVRQLVYGNPDEKIATAWPEIDSKEVEKVIDAILSAITLNGQLKLPMGTPQDVVTILHNAGFKISEDAETWQDVLNRQPAVPATQIEPAEGDDDGDPNDGDSATNTNDDGETSDSGVTQTNGNSATESSRLDKGYEENALEQLKRLTAGLKDVATLASEQLAVDEENNDPETEDTNEVHEVEPEG